MSRPFLISEVLSVFIQEPSPFCFPLREGRQCFPSDVGDCLFTIWQNPKGEPWETGCWGPDAD